MILHVFNPENDLALADGGANYSPTPAACRIAYDLASLPLWFADASDAVLLPDESHRNYACDMARIFTLAKPHDNDGQITECKPWGWSRQLYRRLQSMGFQDSLPAIADIDEIRELSNRKSSIRILSELADKGFDIPELPSYFTASDEVAQFVNTRSRCVVKAPWSGSGKGIMYGLGRVERPLENFYKGIIRRQGGVVCENYLNGMHEFAMEFHANESGVSFSGYSLFNSSKGAYTGNVLMQDSAIEELLAKYISLEELHRLKEELAAILHSMSIGKCYTGYLGVDMMIYDDDGMPRLNPCMELNLRMNMGMLSRMFYDRFVVAGKRGEYRVSFFKNDGEAYAMHLENMKKYPLVIENGRILSGYIPLSPVTAGSRYTATAIIYS